MSIWFRAPSAPQLTPDSSRQDLLTYIKAQATLYHRQMQTYGNYLEMPSNRPHYEEARMLYSQMLDMWQGLTGRLESPVTGERELPPEHRAELDGDGGVQALIERLQTAQGPQPYYRVGANGQTDEEPIMIDLDRAQPLSEAEARRRGLL